MSNSDSSQIHIPNRLPVLPLPYPLVLHPGLVLSIPLSYAHSLSLLKAALQLTGDDSKKNLEQDSDSKDNKGNDKPIIVACVPTLRVPGPPTNGSKSKAITSSTTISDDSDGRVRINDLYDWGCAARLIRLTRDSASQTCTLSVTGLSRVRIDRWLSVRAPLTSTTLDEARNLSVPDIPVPLAATTTFSDQAVGAWPPSPVSDSDGNLIKILKLNALELLDALSVLSPPSNTSSRKNSNLIDPPQISIPGPGVPLLPPALLKRLRSFVKDSRDAPLLADVLLGTLGGACEWSSRVGLLGEFDPRERVRLAGKVIADGAARVRLARELLQALSAPLNPNSKEALIRAQLEALLTQLAALNPNITARITTGNGSFSVGSNRVKDEDGTDGKVGGIITIRTPGRSNNDSGSAPRPIQIKPRGSSNGASNPFGRIPGNAQGGNGNGGNDEEADELAELSAKLDRARLTPEAKKVCDKELKRLSRIPAQSVERGVVITYLEIMSELPWNTSSEDIRAEEASQMAQGKDPRGMKRLDNREGDPSEGIVSRARRILDEDHFGLEKVKKRLIEYLAVLELKTEQANEKVKQIEIEEKAEEKKLALAGRKEQREKMRKTGATTESFVDEDKEEEGEFNHLEDQAEEEIKKKREVEDRRKQRRGEILAAKGQPTILLMVGPPGVGKTSIAKSLASALRRPFTRLSLGGVRDEAEIRGHRRTYVGALPGTIVSSLRKVQANDAVILLDEIDKLGSGNGHHGDPMAAMLEVLDPEQNHAFGDHYINTPVDLSKIIFIATANSLETISPPLLDRCEVLEISGYTANEKVKIAKSFLLPKQRKNQGLAPEELQVGDDVLLKVSTSFTREAGVRSLERQIGAIARAKAVQYAEARKGILKDEDGNKKEYDPKVTLDELEKLLGIETYEPEIADKEARPGVVTGLAYQGSGNGGILHIESLLLPPNNGNLRLSGSLGDVIKESAELALSWVKAHAYQLGIVPERDSPFPKNDIHLHLPSGQIKKDGPSAGCAMTVALVGLFTRTSVSPTLAMTGEMTLRGKVTPVGGIKEKLLGAHRAGISRVLLPVRNRKDVEADLPKEVRAELEIIYVNTIWNALDAAFGNSLYEHVVGNHEGVQEGRRMMSEFEDSRL